ncbi:MAG: preprotein translocase subunit YajC [Terriglobales bacterium]|jgi:preprotein translocase subunit YajC
MALTAILMLQSAGGGALVGLMPIILMVAVFYFLLLAPQQRKQKKWQEMVNELKTGDKVITNGGLRGTIISIKDDAIQLRVPPDNLRLEVARNSIASVAKPEEAA